MTGQLTRTPHIFIENVWPGTIFMHIVYLPQESIANSMVNSWEALPFVVPIILWLMVPWRYPFGNQLSLIMVLTETMMTSWQPVLSPPPSQCRLCFLWCGQSFTYHFHFSENKFDWVEIFLDFIETNEFSCLFTSPPLSIPLYFSCVYFIWVHTFFPVCIFIMETCILKIKFVNKYTVVVSSIVLKCVGCIARKAVAKWISITQCC